MADFDSGIRHTGIKTVQPDDVDQTSLPASYGDNRLILMARDPTSAHAYWEINVDRINKAATFLGGGKAFLRLVEPSTERILAEYETRAGHGRYWMPLPRAGRAYRADLAMVQNGRAVVLGRSNIVHAPPDERTALASFRVCWACRTTQRAATTPYSTYSDRGRFQHSAHRHGWRLQT